MVMIPTSTSKTRLVSITFLSGEGWLAAAQRFSPHELGGCTPSRSQRSRRQTLKRHAHKKLRRRTSVARLLLYFNPAVNTHFAEGFLRIAVLHLMRAIRHPVSRG